MNSTGLLPSSPSSPPPSPWSVRQLLRGALAATLPRRLFLVRGPAAGKSVCLTFDDGPHPEHTPRLLDALKEHRVKATFFVIGQQMERYPDLVRRMSGEGHAVGHHSFTHGQPGQTSAGQLLEEVRRTQELFETVLEMTSRLFRPPHGKLTIRKLWRLWQAGLSVILWNVDPKDYQCQSADEVRNRLKAHPWRSGDVLLMHDTHPHAAMVVPDLVAAANQQGLTFTTISDWLTR